MLTACKGLPPLARLRHTQVSTSAVEKQGRQCDTSAHAHHAWQGLFGVAASLSKHWSKAQITVCRAVLCSEGTNVRQVSTARETFEHARLGCALLGVSLGIAQLDVVRGRLRETVREDGGSARAQAASSHPCAGSCAAGPLAALLMRILWACRFGGTQNTLDTGRHAAASPAAAALADQMWSPVTWPASANRAHSAYIPQAAGLCCPAITVSQPESCSSGAAAVLRGIRSTCRVMRRCCYSRRTRGAPWQVQATFCICC